MKAKWGYTKNKRELRRIYASILPTIRDVAQKAGYAVGVHGSMVRDLDLIACPWIEKCVTPEVLARRIELAICEYPRKERYHWKKVRENATKKPHGRIGFAIYLGRHAYVDLSIIEPCAANSK